MKPLKVESRYFISSIALLAVCLPTSAAWAQDQAKAPSEPDDQAGAGEIVVTAQKRQESVNKVGMSISAFSGDALVKGTDFAVVAGGRLQQVTGFLDQVPAGAA